MSGQDHVYALPSGFMLEEYRLEKELGAGGFGITYYAWDTHLNKAVAIKEYMPGDCAARYDKVMVAPRSSSDANTYDWGLNRFLEEAQVLARFDHPHINRVYRQFQAHGTAYIVLEYVPGETLSARLRRNGRLSPEEVWRLFNELLSGLLEVHRQDYVHRDIKPGNIMFREDGGAVLLDFGAARQAVGQRTQSIASILTPGYAPLEQYDQKAADVGPWSDFYALGVVAYRCVTGVGERELLDAVARARLASRGEREKDMRPAVELAKGQYDQRLLKAIDSCMRVDERERPQGVADLKEILADGVPEIEQHSEPVTGPDPAPPGRLLSKVFRDTLQSGGEGPEMVVLPTGSFRMGDLSGVGEKSERPVRTVTIHRRIAMGKYPVTFKEYDRFVDDQSRSFWAKLKARFQRPQHKDWGRGTRPVIFVSWEDARAYALWLSKQTGKRYRLPSEAEWEYAARAGATTEYSWGNDIDCRRANCSDCGSEWDGEKTAPVGSFAANAFGLHDMHGNVWEWIEDCWHDNYEGAPIDGSAWTTGCDGWPRAVLRGGSWSAYPRWLRSAARGWVAPLDRSDGVGFRLVRDITP